MKFLILILLLLPVFAQAETVIYTIKDSETIEDVRANFAEEYNVPAESLWIWDNENDPSKLFIEIPVMEDGTIDRPEPQVLATSTDNTAELEAKIAQLQQLIQLLIQLIELKNEQNI